MDESCHTYERVIHILFASSTKFCRRCNMLLEIIYGWVVSHIWGIHSYIICICDKALSQVRYVIRNNIWLSCVTHVRESFIYYLHLRQSFVAGAINYFIHEAVMSLTWMRHVTLLISGCLAVLKYLAVLKQIAVLLPCCCRVVAVLLQCVAVCCSMLQCVAACCQTCHD